MTFIENHLARPSRLWRGSATAYMMGNKSAGFNGVKTLDSQAETDPIRQRRVKEAAKRALAEAEARRAEKVAPSPTRETGGREGPDPTRYGDWEVKGLASDF